MTTYLIRRAFWGVVIMFLASFLIYSIMMVTPGGPLSQLNFAAGSRGHKVDQNYVDAIKKVYKIDKPWPLNYFVWLFDPTDTTRVSGYNDLVPKGIDINIFGLEIKGSGAIVGEFGDSLQYASGTPVMTLIGGFLPNTLILMSLALLTALVIAFPIGIISAIRQYSRLDYTVTAFSFFGLSMPSFWLGLMLIIFLAVFPQILHTQFGWTWLPYLPTGDTTDYGRETDFINRAYHLLLPVTVLSFINIAGWSRYVRASMLEVLRQDYVRTAWAKGLSQRAVILKHALRNALIPLITLLTLSIPGLVQGAIITEQVFNYHGMGQLYIRAVEGLDFTVVMAFLVIITFLTVVSTMLADVLYAVVDPRIRYS